MKLQQKQSTFTKNVSLLIECMFDNDYLVTFGEAYRTPEQAEIYAKSGKGIKNSLHCKKLAIDLNLFNSEGKFLEDKNDYEKFGIYWESMNPANRWGGNFKTLVDCVHFEMQDL